MIKAVAEQHTFKSSAVEGETENACLTVEGCLAIPAFPSSSYKTGTCLYFDEKEGGVWAKVV